MDLFSKYGSSNLVAHASFLLTSHWQEIKRNNKMHVCEGTKQKTAQTHEIEMFFFRHVMLLFTFIFIFTFFLL